MGSKLTIYRIKAKVKKLFERFSFIEYVKSEVSVSYGSKVKVKGLATNWVTAQKLDALKFLKG